MRWSSADLKRGTLGSKNKIPKEGTNIRRLYDIFISEKKLKLEGKSNTATVSAIESLNWTYGLDIRNVGNRVYICFGTEDEDFALQAQELLDEERKNYQKKPIVIPKRPYKHKPFKGKYDFRNIEIGKSVFMPADQFIADCNEKFTTFGTTLQKAARRQNPDATFVSQRVEAEGKRHGFIVSRVA